MPTAVYTEDLAARWRTDAGDDNPAGPLFSSGPYAEVELAEPMAAATALCESGRCGTACSYSYTRVCC